MGDKLYRLRNRNHKIEGPLSEAEILVGVRAGKFNGEEEICQGQGAGPWLKLGAHPKFYDEFLRRLFENKYEVSNYTEAKESNVQKDIQKESGEPRETQSDEGPPLLKEGAQKESSDSPLSESEGRGGLTIHQSEIDLLFSKVPDVNGAKEATEIARHPDRQSRPVDLGPKASGADTVIIAPRRLQVRKIVFLSVLVLVGLYYFGSSPREPRLTDTQTNEGRESRRGVKYGRELPEAYSTLVSESDELFRFDIPVFLRAAEKSLDQAISFDETRADAFGKLSLVLSRQYFYAERKTRPPILQKLQKVLERGRLTEPQLAIFYVAEGECALVDGDITAAKRFLRFAEETSPGGFLAEQLRFELELSQGADEALLDRLRKVVAPASHRLRLAYSQAAVEKRLGKLNDARKTILGALQENPVHSTSYFLLGEVFSGQNDFTNAKNAFETAGRLAKLNPFQNVGPAYLRLSEVQQLLGQKEASSRSLKLALFFGATEAEVAQRAPDLRLDRESFRGEAEKETYDSHYFADQGRVLLSERNYPAAALFYRVASQLEPTSAEYRTRVGEATELMASTVAQFHRALYHYRSAVEVDAKSMEALVRLGLLETDLYHFDSGFEVLSQAAALRPDAVEPMIALGKHFFKRQDFKSSLEQFLSAKKIAPLDPLVPYYAGRLIMRFSKEQMREAMALFYRSHTLDPQNYDSLIEWLKLKVVYYEKNFAIKFVNSLIQQNPNNANYRWALGEIYGANSEFNRAIKHYHQALDLDNRNGKVRMALANALRAIGETEASVEEYRLSSRLDIRNGEGYFKASELNLEAKNYLGAERDIMALISVLPDYPGAHRQLSKLSYFKGNREFAVSELRKEVDKNPLNTAYRQELAELLYEYRKIDEAVIELSQITNLPNRNKAPEFTRDKIRAFLWLSRCHRASNRFESAEGAIKLALDLDPNDPELIREHGFVLQGERRDKEAAVAFEAYLKRNPAATDAEQIRKIIQQLVIEE